MPTCFGWRSEIRIMNCTVCRAKNLQKLVKIFVLRNNNRFVGCNVQAAKGPLGVTSPLQLHPSDSTQPYPLPQIPKQMQQTNFGLSVVCAPLFAQRPEVSSATVPLRSTTLQTNTDSLGGLRPYYKTPMKAARGNSGLLNL